MKSISGSKCRKQCKKQLFVDFSNKKKVYFFERNLTMKACNKILSLILIFVWLTPTVHAECCANWIKASAPSGAYITKPADDTAYLAGATVSFTCTRASDMDYYFEFGDCCEEGYAGDILSTNHPRWTASSGSFPTGCIGTAVTWQAPDTEQTNIEIFIYEDDKPSDICECCTGTRDDDEQVQDYHEIHTVIPEPDSVGYTTGDVGGNEHALYDVTDPVWKRVSNPGDPASYTKNTRERLEVKFWDSKTLSEGEYVDIDGWSAAWLLDVDESVTFGFSWPSEASYHLSTNATANEINKYTSTYSFKYKCPAGSDNWITMTSTTGAISTYAVFFAPNAEQGGEYYIEDNLDWACSAAVGETTVIEIADAIHSALNDDPPLESGTTQVDDWRLLEGSPYYGDHLDQAYFMWRVLHFLGIYNEIGGHGAYSGYHVYASSDSGAGNCLSMEWKTEESVIQWLILDADTGAGYSWRPYQGVVRVDDEGEEDYWYSVLPSIKATDDYDMLTDLDFQQYWVKTVDNKQPGTAGWAVETVYDEEPLP
ncbi:MAG: hypothetical protein ACYS1A_17295 [Planctomycetota bacterium]|jgi:hypothetical protein